MIQFVWDMARQRCSAMMQQKGVTDPPPRSNPVILLSVLARVGSASEVPAAYSSLARELNGVHDSTWAMLAISAALDIGTAEPRMLMQVASDSRKSVTQTNGKVARWMSVQQKPLDMNLINSTCRVLMSQSTRISCPPDLNPVIFNAVCHSYPSQTDVTLLSTSALMYSVHLPFGPSNNVIALHPVTTVLVALAHACGVIHRQAIPVTIEALQMMSGSTLEEPEKNGQAACILFSRSAWTERPPHGPSYQLVSAFKGKQKEAEYSPLDPPIKIDHLAKERALTWLAQRRVTVV